MLYDLFLDDERAPAYINTERPTILCRTVEQFVEVVERLGVPVEFHLDHDLGPDTGTGADCMKRLVENFDLLNTNRHSPKFYIHSQNPIGKANIAGYIADYQRLEAGNLVPEKVDSF